MNAPMRILVFFMICCLVGCQAEPRPTLWQGDMKAVSDILADWTDVDKTDTTACQFLFAKDSQPTVDQIKTLRQLNIMPNGEPKISGTTAIYPVLIFNQKKKGEPVPMDWTFEKEGEVWKIKTAPTP